MTIRSSFPRKRESSAFFAARSHWIPAFAGMTSRGHVMKPLTHIHSRTAVLRASEHRHRPHHPGALPDDDRTHRPRQIAVQRLALQARRLARSGFRVEQARSARLRNPRRRPQLRLRLVARTRAVGAARLRHPRRAVERDRRHLPRQCAEERPARRRARAKASIAICSNIRASNSRIDIAGGFIELPDGGRFGFELEPFARHCLLSGVDQLGFMLQNADAIAAFERQREAA